MIFQCPSFATRFTCYKCYFDTDVNETKKKSKTLYFKPNKFVLNKFFYFVLQDNWQVMYFNAEKMLWKQTINRTIWF